MFGRCGAEFAGRVSSPGRDRTVRWARPGLFRCAGPFRPAGRPWPQSTMESTLRPPSWFCTAAMVRRTSPMRTCGWGGSPPRRVVRRKTTRPSLITVRSASSERRSISSRNSPWRVDSARAKSDGGRACPEDQAPRFQSGGLAGLLNLLDQFGADGGGQDGAGFVGPVAQGHEIQEPFLVELVELAHGLEADQVGQFFVRGGGQEELAQFDVRASDGDQGVQASQAACAQGGGKPGADIHFRFIGAGLAGPQTRRQRPVR